MMSVVIFCQAENLVEIFLNKSFSDSIGVLRVMAIYPPFITLNTLNGTFFYATEQVKLYRNISIVGMITNIFFSYVFIAPKDYIVPGLGLHAYGTAINYIFNAVLFTTIQTFFISKYLKLRFEYFIYKQSKVLLVLSSIGAVIYFSVSAIAMSHIAHIFIFVIMYLVLIGISVLIRPDLAGVERKDLNRYGSSLRRATADVFRSRKQNM